VSISVRRFGVNLQMIACVLCDINHRITGSIKPTRYRVCLITMVSLGARLVLFFAGFRAVVVKFRGEL
jgi:hypothetical protein